MSREWQPGDVAICTQHPDKAVVVVKAIAHGEWHHPGYSIPQRIADTDVRPLVVIDPEDREQVERLVEAFRSGPDWYSGIKREATDALQAALREFANPTPPKPPEPGLWAVVGAHVEGVPRRRWVHHEEDRWICDSGEWRYWDDLTDPELIREGISDA